MTLGTNNYFYHAGIRKVIIAFGNLFSNINVIRVDSDKNVASNVQVPIGYGPREKWLTRATQDPKLDRNISMILPRIAFQMIGLSYDASRKINMNNKIRVINSNNQPISIITPVPYNITFKLDIVANMSNDVLQIMEQIVPFFTPQYNISIFPLDNIDMHKDIPIEISPDINIYDNYDDEWDKERYIIYTLTFTAKTELYADLGNQGVIKYVDVNIRNMNNIIQESYTAQVVPSSANITDNYTISENWNIEDIFPG